MRKGKREGEGLIAARHNCPRARSLASWPCEPRLCRANTQPLCDSQAEEPTFLPSKSCFNQGSRSFLQPPGGDCNAKHISV